MSRRDSFITHRAFCDALAEETARFTAASNNINQTPPNLNYHFIGSQLGLGQHQHLVQHFPSTMFKSSSTHPRDLPLWNNIPHDHHHSITKNLQEMHHHQFTLDHSLIQNPNPNPNPNPPASSYHMMNWDFPNHHNSPMMKEISIPSLFSVDHQNQSQGQSQNCAAISATALLQRAAQIGAKTTATTTTNTADSSNILGKFGRDEDGDKLCGLYSTTNSGTSGLGSDVELSVSNLSALNHEMEKYPPPSKRCRRGPTEEEIGLGETRDFLGVGMHTICNPSSINGWI